MTENEIIQLLAIATANFPSYQGRNMKPTAELWMETLSDIDFKTAKMGLIKVLSTSRFFPTVADIRDAVAELTNPRTMDWSEAWGLITTAIRRFGMYRSDEGLSSLPPDIREMAKRFTWRELCLNETPDTLRAQFRMAWETNAKRVREYNQLPQEIRTFLDNATGGMKMIE